MTLSAPSSSSPSPGSPTGALAPVLTWPIFAGLGLEAVVTTRGGGVSSDGYTSLNLGLHVGDDVGSVLTNRRRAAAAIGGSIEDLVFCEQVHRPEVAVVTAADRGRGATSAADAIAGVDALITLEPGPVLVIMVADCVPIVLFDPVRRILACVHAGWTGTVRGVTSAVLERLRTLGSDPADLLVGIGPSIHPDRYQVGADVVEAATAAFGARVDEVVRPDGTGAWNFDLWQANLIQLTEAGVPAGQVQFAGLDTGPGTPFFSHRSEAPCGRFAVLARLVSPSESPETPLPEEISQ
jgi:YfiH family protein